MSHLTQPPTRIHRYQGDTPTLLVPVDGTITAAQVTAAQFAVAGITKTLGQGVTVDDDDGTLVVSIPLSASETRSISPSRYLGHVRVEAGSTAQTVAEFELHISASHADPGDPE